MAQEIQGGDINEVPDLEPVEIPGRDISPSIEDRLAQVEEVLRIN